MCIAVADKFEMTEFFTGNKSDRFQYDTAAGVAEFNHLCMSISHCCKYFSSSFLKQFIFTKYIVSNSFYRHSPHDLFSIIYRHLQIMVSGTK